MAIRPTSWILKTNLHFLTLRIDIDMCQVDAVDIWWELLHLCEKYWHFSKSKIVVPPSCILGNYHFRPKWPILVCARCMLLKCGENIASSLRKLLTFWNSRWRPPAAAILDLETLAYLTQGMDTGFYRCRPYTAEIWWQLLDTCVNN